MNSTTVRPIVILCEGNIGSGKTTLVNSFIAEAERISRRVIPVYEPLDDEIVPLLDEFYGNPTSPCYEIEELFIRKRYETTMAAIERAQTNGIDSRNIVLVDRSLYGNSCFLRGVYTNGRITDAEYKELRRLESSLMDKLPTDLMVYLDTPPEVCLKRISKRGRENESTIPLSYLNQITQEHLLMIKRIRGRFPIEIVDANTSSEDVLCEFVDIVSAMF